MDIRGADLPLLVSLDALLAEGSVTAAARRLGLSQPALSAQLARLRDLFADPLLVPSGRRLVPTARAEALREPLRQALSGLSALLLAEAFEPARAEKSFRIIGSDHMHAVFSLRVGTALAKAGPGLRLAMLATDARTTARRLAADEADCALVSGTTRLDGCLSETLWHEHFVGIRRPGHPSTARPMTAEAFCAAAHALVSPEGGGFFGATDAALARLGLARRVALSLPSFLLAPRVVAQSDLLAVVPARLAQAAAGQVEVFALPFDVPGFAVLLAWHPRHARDPALLWLRALAARLAGAQA